MNKVKALGLALIAAVALTACGEALAPPSSGASHPAGQQATKPTLDRTVLKHLTDQASAETQAGIDALERYDGPGAAVHFEASASSLDQLAGLIEPQDQAAGDLVRQAATHLRASAADLNANDPVSATAEIKAATAEIKEATPAIQALFGI